MPLFRLLKFPDRNFYVPLQPIFCRVTGADPSRNIVEQVRAKVSSGALSPGDRLPSERDFAEQLGVSRNTVRKAVNALSQSGLVTVRKGASGGAFISQGGGDAIRMAMGDLFHLGGINSQELTEARMVLIRAIVALACERCTEKDIRILEQNVAAAEAAIAEGDITSRMRLNIDFYRLLAMASKNELFILLVDAMNQVLFKYAGTIGLVASAKIMPVRRKIISCLRTQDAEAAQEIITQHLNSINRQYKKLEKKMQLGTVPVKSS